eukprot:jgi/Chrpa1/19091/Chrysochromulina_OHIO_Genome00023051-RA
MLTASSSAYNPPAPTHASRTFVTNGSSTAPPALHGGVTSVTKDLVRFRRSRSSETLVGSPFEKVSSPKRPTYRG